MRKLHLVLLGSLVLASHLSAKYGDQFEQGTQSSAAFHYQVQQSSSLQNKWWGDYCASGKPIHLYVDELASKDSEAALWFLTTGGKNGFSSKQATLDEEKSLYSAMSKVAKQYSSSPNNKQGLEAWKNSTNSAGHIHLQMIYSKIDELEVHNKKLEKELTETKQIALMAKEKATQLEESLVQTKKKD